MQPECLRLLIIDYKIVGRQPVSEVWHQKWKDMVLRINLCIQHAILELRKSQKLFQMAQLVIRCPRTLECALHTVFLQPVRYIPVPLPQSQNNCVIYRVRLVLKAGHHRHADSVPCLISQLPDHGIRHFARFFMVCLHIGVLCEQTLHIRFPDCEMNPVMAFYPILFLELICLINSCKDSLHAVLAY